MSAEDAKSSGSRSKPTTRSSSLRQSLNLASYGKALIAGVRSKDSSDDSKSSKKSKVTASRRHSSIISPTAAPQPQAPPRQSIGDARPVSQSNKRDNTPESKTITRRRVSGNHQRSSTDEQPTMKPAEPANRSATLRPRPPNASSALPKLRPRSAVVEQAKPSTPTSVRAGTRRRLSTSSEEGKEQRKPRSATPQEKVVRPISPLPHRAALKASSAVNATPPVTPSTPSKLKPPTPSGNRTSPSRPAKLLKTTAASSTTSLPRPSSSASSVSGGTPRTPKSTTLKAVLGRSAKDRTITGNTPVKNSPITPARDTPSPLARHSRNISKYASSSSSNVGNMSHISEANSEDSEEDDVLLLLAPIANLGAPTPAMPRIQKSRSRQAPNTPTRDRPVKDKSRLAAPPNIITRTTHLRPPRAPGLSGSTSARQSILSWEQLSNDASRTLGEGEVERMIADIPAPFSGPTSPALSSIIDIPPSPCLSAIDSPGGYGSISQVLLPDVTPSPAVFSSSARFSISPEAAGESSATYVRLQLAAAENMANERLLRIQAMEEELNNLKQVHAFQIEEMTTQIAYMETEDERAGYATSLEEQIRVMRVSNEKAIESAVSEAEENAQARRASALMAQETQFKVSYAALMGENAWSSVGDACKTELESTKGEREMLALLLMDLETIILGA
ncbi:hypothetical protein FA15DRAFT_4285 [Coprinopsis marcescibilis]|uniref:Uncharacterized protein n=1 Tax=Coprinopsis marcescibilis TaxID=230819 RepID=A0A5C3LD51_COPMA|nr:hypothetical protein FA15DRAFT_4285 [Coprinopsis marcescibilis]